MNTSTAHSQSLKSYTDYDRIDGPVYVIEDPQNDEARIQSTVSVPVEP